jgi:hypothetical protein
LDSFVPNARVGVLGLFSILQLTPDVGPKGGQAFAGSLDVQRDRAQTLNDDSAEKQHSSKTEPHPFTSGDIALAIHFSFLHVFQHLFNRSARQRLLLKE